jgi:hypothetical protein
MFSEALHEFCGDVERNPFAFVHSHDNSIEIDGFSFTMSLLEGKYRLESSEEFLATFVNNYNKSNVGDIMKSLELLTIEYAHQIKDVTPLYNNQDIFELENDNHDMKFTDRIRYSEGDFNFDLFYYIFDFLDPIGRIFL